MKKELKLLIIAKSVDGGTGTFIKNLLGIEDEIENLDSRILGLEKPNYRKLKGKNKYIFLRKNNFYPQRYSMSIKNVQNFIEEILWVKKEIKKFQPDLIISVDVHCNLISSILKSLLIKNIPLIITTHTNLKDAIKNKSNFLLYQISKRIINHYYDIPDYIVCTSKQVANNLKIDFKLKKDIVTIYNGTKLNNNYSSNINKKKKVIISIARLVEQKDLITLINAFNLLQKELPESMLWIIGDGPLKNTFVNYSNKLSASKRVKFLGWKQNVDLYIKRSDIFVLSTEREGFAQVLIEALAYGKPVISTNAPYGPKEVLGNGKYGILIPIADIYKMKNAMLKLLTDKKTYQYFSKKAYTRAKYFSEEKMIKAYKDLILKTLD